MLYIVGNCPIDSMPIFFYLIAKLHIFSDISINLVIYFTSVRISSSSGTVSRDLFSATVPPVHDARYIFAGL